MLLLRVLLQNCSSEAASVVVLEAGSLLSWEAAGTKAHDKKVEGCEGCIPALTSTEFFVFWTLFLLHLFSGTTSVENKVNPEDTWDSKEWLQKYGLKAQKLSFYDVLADCSFRRADGVVDIKAKPEDETVQTSADTNRKTIHAKYCNRFVHTPWKDGSLVHVNITKEKCKWYREKVHIVLARIQRRIKWLQDGSQLLFGKVHKDCIYVLIDTSHSMKSKLNLVKDKIIWFIQPPEMVIEEVKPFSHIPIHTVSFSYHDEIANEFLRELASLTGGEFHAYHFGCKDPIPQETVQASKGTHLYELQPQKSVQALNLMLNQRWLHPQIC